MKLEELRLGNWVFEELDNELYEVTINLSHFNHYPIDIALKPISLNHEWLLKFGFEVDSVNGSEDEYYDIEVKSGNKLSVRLCQYFQIGFDSIWTNGIEIQYVHQLQNLYFSLTGQELTIK